MFVFKLTFKLLYLMLLLLLAGCGGDEGSESTTSAATTAGTQLHVAEVQMARRRVDGGVESIEPAQRFGSQDSIIAVVLTQGIGDDHELAARWYFGQSAEPIHEEAHRITAKGEDIHAFGLNKADGFPLGEYSVEIRLDGRPANRRTFLVE